MATFKVGDKVRVVLPNDYRCAGEEGVVSNVHLPWSPVVTFLSEDVDGDTELGFANSELEFVSDTVKVSDTETNAARETVDVSRIVNDPVEHPGYYTAYGAEVIEIAEHLNFCRGNAVKYIARAGLKDPSKEVEDLEKAAWYLTREINRLNKETS